MDKTSVKEILNRCPELKSKLFARGFYFTNDDVKRNEYPFYGLWRETRFGPYTLMVSPDQSNYVASDDEYTIVLVGHAYNPYSMECDESKILGNFLERLQQSWEQFYQVYNELTGVFTCVVICKDGKVMLLGDASGMQTAFYCQCGDKIYISSHTNCLGDLLNLTWDPYIEALARYKFFPLLGNTLPGDLTQFSQVKRLVPNHMVTFCHGEPWRVKRYYTPKVLKKITSEIVDEVANLLHRNLELIAQKWDKPAISMTGGCDSKTTLACTQGLYDSFSYFSYTSSESESVDAQAAHQICEALHLQHRIDEISAEDKDYLHIEEVRAIIFWNSGGIIPINRNDVRKRCFYQDTQNFDVEVKSWASEIGRSYYSKRFHKRTNFGQKPTPRACTTMYKFFLHNRKLVKQTDKVFADYLDKYWEQDKNCPVDWQEQFFWEFRVPSWNGLVITGEHRYSFDITIPYNNRHMLELLLSVPIEQRISDEVYRQIREKMNPVIDQTGIAVTNLKHTENRERAENLYYTIHSRIPF